jgi:hypothetical protein
MTERLRSLRKPAKCRSETSDARRSEKRGVCALPPKCIDGWQLSKTGPPGHKKRPQLGVRCSKPEHSVLLHTQRGTRLTPPSGGFFRWDLTDRSPLSCIMRFVQSTRAQPMQAFASAAVARSTNTAPCLPYAPRSCARCASVVRGRAGHGDRRHHGAALGECLITCPNLTSGLADHGQHFVASSCLVFDKRLSDGPDVIPKEIDTLLGARSTM